ncbi:MAG: hypothetical protein HY800_03405, partial [Ignavibacteriales bacterium]|nr:hypothetical protein [Ignavibacteriales bacterium]
MNSTTTYSEKRKNLLIISSLLLLTIIFRTAFWFTTNTTLEDAFITFKYAENLAAGNGFVYNLNEHILGTTSPLWTLLLAASKYISGADVIIFSKILGIIFDSLTLIIIFLIFRKQINQHFAIIFAVSFSTSPDIIIISTSGMETPLLLFGMSLTISGLVNRNFLLPLPWFFFCYFYFDNIIPQSLVAKSASYNYDISRSASPFIGTFTPLNDDNLIKIIFRLTLMSGILIGVIHIIKKYRMFLSLGIFFISYCVVFSFSGTLIFRWYLIPVIFISMVVLTFGIDWIIQKIKPLLDDRLIKIVILLIILILGGINIYIALHRTDKYRQLQALEDELRKGIGLWVKENIRSGSSILLEPLGYIGYYGGTSIKYFDEIGIVTQLISELRKVETDWYFKSITMLQPEYILQYKSAYDENKNSESSEPLFETESNRRWFLDNYLIVRTFRASNQYPLIDDKEKAYILFRRKYSTTNFLGMSKLNRGNN